MTGTALVTGATGAIGPGLVQQLAAAGYRVKAMARRPPPAGLWSAPVELIRGDITDEPLLRQAAAGVDLVFHLAAKLHVPNPSAALAPEYERVNVDGARCVVQAARAAQVRRVVFFSTISVYGPSNGCAAFDETSTPNPQTLYGRSKHQAEQVVLAARRPEDDEPLGVVLRLAAVYGPRIKGNYARLVRALHRRRFVPIGPGTNRRTLVHEQDVVSAALVAGETPQAAGQIYNVTDGQTHRFADIVAAICEGLGQPPPRWRLPVYPVRLAAGTVEQAYGWLGKTPPVGRFTIDKLIEEVVISGQKIQRELGFQPQYDLKRGWLATIEQMKLA